MIDAAMIEPEFLDVPTLVFATVCIVGFLGVFMIVNWLQQREVFALAWWGSAYLIAASAIALWGAPSPLFEIPSVWPEALVFVACGMIWNGVRLFHGRKLWPLAIAGGAGGWVVLCHAWDVPEGGWGRIALGVMVGAAYTVCISVELSHERRRSFYSRGAAIAVPLLYAVLFLSPVALWLFRPDFFAVRWPAVLALETIIYAVATAFILLLTVKDRHVHFYRTAATTDSLTGLLNRGAFLEAARKMQMHHGARGRPVTLLMFDLDHFKSVNDRFGHATGDSVLRIFTQVARNSMRATDLIGRLGGEEFVALVPEPMAGAVHIAERLRAAFESAGVTVDGHAIGATVSSGLASSCKQEPDIGSLLVLADVALYRAKNEGRNRFFCAAEETATVEAGSAASPATAGEATVADRPINAADSALAG
ncbi:MAG: GGDEF domain-containing protein [Pseudolabrys sp.]|nr:GGDEF domain-containing protein [Pseudolabrys sp.]